MRGVGDRRADLEILEDGHARKDAPSLGRVRDAEAHDLVGLRLGDVAVVEEDAALRRARAAADRHQEGRFAGAVRADEGDDLVPADGEIDALEGLDIAVEGMDAGDGEHRQATSSSPR